MRSPLTRIPHVLFLDSPKRGTNVKLNFAEVRGSAQRLPYGHFRTGESLCIVSGLSVFGKAGVAIARHFHVGKSVAVVGIIDVCHDAVRSHAARRGYRLDHRSRPITADDFDRFDVIIGMDDMNIENLRRLAPDADSLSKIHRMADYARRYGHDYVPDPYYSGADGFELVLDLLEDACGGLIDALSVPDA